MQLLLRETSVNASSARCTLMSPCAEVKNTGLVPSFFLGETSFLMILATLLQRVNE